MGRRRQKASAWQMPKRGSPPERRNNPPLRRNDSRPLSGAANRAAASKAARLLRHRRRVAAFPPAGTAEKIRPARLKRGLGGNCNVHRRSEEPAPPEEQDSQYTSGQKGVLRTAGSKRLFRPFLSAQKGARRRSGEISHRCGATIPGPCPGPPIMPLLLTVGPNRLTGAARACQPGPILEISSLTLPPAALR